jgi:hypothetical protein
MEAAQHEDAPSANNRAVKLPPFWNTNPRAWFTSAEGAGGGVRRSRDAVAAAASDSRCPTRTRPGSGVGCASTTSATGLRLRSVRPPAPGRETRRPGAAQHRRCRAADSHAGSNFQQVFPSGHLGFLQHPATSFLGLGPEAVWPIWSAYSLLGRLPGAAQIPFLA